ncbi:OLC1v1017294C1 [Oldenlandia corymbosa var. corymbosa]|uniref:Probable purine permease n=1 Tax=Oldenlandia corymbosa var. corymbosa TaxID=529605 RepID=A0AAV1E948_OLDCO|nr:OLC1v1017294C1 [Oldenlandia corymbosa var. corymbosa]
MEETQVSNTIRKALLVINCLILAIGNCGGPMIMRLYFIKGGKRIWFSSWLQSGGWPIIFIPLLISYYYRRKTQGSQNTKLVLMKYPVFVATAVIGVLTGLDNYLYAYGVARLPVSTAAIVIASQLGFTAFFAFFLVKQKFTPYSVNAIVLLTFGAGVLALHSSGDRPKDQSKMSYVLGFIMTLAAAALYGLILPMVELMYMKAKQAITYTLVLEIQLVMCFFATAFCTVGMLVNHDFQALPREAREYELGETKYNLVIVWSAIVWQFFFLGAIGVVSCASSLVSGIMMAVLLPVTQVLAVIFFKEKFQALKGVALVLSLWGFVSYFYGEIKHNNKSELEEKTPFRATEMMVTPTTDP